MSSPNDDSLPSIVCYDGKETPDAEVAADGSCNCRWSRFHGLPCRHIFAVAKGKNAKTLPDSVVRPRWSAEAPVRLSVPADASTTALIRHHENAALIHYVDYNEYMQICSKLFEPLRRSGHVQTWLQDAYGRVGVTQAFNTSVSTSMVPEGDPVSTAPRVVTEATTIETLVICDPPNVRAKGRPKKNSIVAGRPQRIKRFRKKPRAKNKPRATFKVEGFCPRSSAALRELVGFVCEGNVGTRGWC